MAGDLYLKDFAFLGLDSHIDIALHALPSLGFKLIDNLGMEKRFSRTPWIAAITYGGSSAPNPMGPQ
ncbi:Hypothetical protein FKW44_010831, partial [Caligus rogercresseyi]